MDDVFFADFDTPMEMETLSNEEMVVLHLREKAVEEYMVLRRMEIGEDEEQHRDDQYNDLMRRIANGTEEDLKEFTAMCQAMVEEQKMVGSPNEEIRIGYEDDVEEVVRILTEGEKKEGSGR